MSTLGHSRARAAIWAVLGLALLVFIIDAGSCAIARIQVDDDAKGAARYTVQQISGLPVNQSTAEVAYSAAQQALPNDAEKVVGYSTNPRKRFQVGQDRSVTMTVRRDAPTLLFKYLPTLKGFTTAEVTVTQYQLGM